MCGSRRGNNGSVPRPEVFRADFLHPTQRAAAMLARSTGIGGPPEIVDPSAGCHCHHFPHISCFFSSKPAMYYRAQLHEGR